MEDLQQFLEKNNLTKYTSTLHEYGAETMSDLIDLNEAELTEAADECGMKKLHKNKFIKGIKEIQSVDAAINNPVPPIEQQPETEEKLTKEDLIEQRVEQLAMQNTELFLILQDDTLMDNYNYFMDHPDDAYSQQLFEEKVRYTLQNISSKDELLVHGYCRNVMENFPKQITNYFIAFVFFG
eukprot:49957_1